MIVAFHELAEQELNDAARYYDREQPGLGAACIADVRRCISNRVTVRIVIQSGRG